MKPMIEKLPVAENRSFVAATHATPRFEVPWHQHIEYELILFTNGEGTSYIGNSIGTFSTGDIFFLGSNLPHSFQKAGKDLFTSAVVVHFKEDFWGKDFLALPETRALRKLFDISSKGLRIRARTQQLLQPMIRQLEFSTGMKSIIRLCECLELIAGSEEFEMVSTQEIKSSNQKHQERIDIIFNYTIENFRDNISLSDIAGSSGMSIPAFCAYFKKSTKKTYVEFLNEVRIGHACKQLMDTQMTIEQICFDSGYSTLANFNKQFLKYKQITPSQFRKTVSTRIESEL
jgi:AraC-like DNA-binding protein/quercetin dioxygenase-like cupin family protein